MAGKAGVRQPHWAPGLRKGRQEWREAAQMLAAGVMGREDGGSQVAFTEDHRISHEPWVLCGLELSSMSTVETVTLWNPPFWM